MNLLGIDASSENVSLSAIREGKIIFDFNRRLTFGASKIVFYLEQYLKKKVFDLKEIDALVVGKGPGSFTGLRVSYAITKALSISLGLPVISIGSFFSMAYNFKQKEEKIAVIADARKNLIYAAAFMVKAGFVRMQGKEQLLPLQEFIAARNDYFFITHDEHIRSQALTLKPHLRFYAGQVWPSAQNLLTLAQSYYVKRKFTALDKLEPLYLHPKTCQIRK